MSLDLSSYKGVRDLYPDQMDLRNYIFAGWRKVVESFGYREYAAPLLEPLAMYAAKSGEEIVNDQTYKFTDRGGREVAIRPEMTPSISRMVAARRQEIALPSRLYSIANFMRYERPQHGREREFWQLNFDIFGAEEIFADAEILEISHKIVANFGAKDSDFTLKINDRRLTDFIFREYLKLNETQTFVMIKLLDKYEKMSREKFEEMAKEIAPDFDFAKFNQIIFAKNLENLPAEIRENSVVNPLKNVLEILEKRGISNAKFDPTLMRGFDYYTGIVFEMFDENPENRRAMFGGGRYDGLVGLFGVEDLPVVGTAPGETMFAEFLRAHNLVPELKSTVRLVLIPLGDVEVSRIADKLRESGVNVATDFTERKLDKKIRAAVKAGAEFVLFAGEDEVARERYNLKNLATNQQDALTIDEIVALFAR